jgi:hypothetical protein
MCKTHYFVKFNESNSYGDEDKFKKAGSTLNKAAGGSSEAAGSPAPAPAPAQAEAEAEAKKQAEEEVRYSKTYRPLTYICT